MKNGFTLIELLVTIAIIGFLALVVYPNVIGIISNSKNDAYTAQTKIIEKAAKAWGFEHSASLPDVNNDSKICVSLSLLTSNGYLAEDEVFDPRSSGKKLEGGVVISYSSLKKQYTYEYKDKVTEAMGCLQN